MKPSAWWAKGLGGFWLSYKSIPEKMRSQVTELFERPTRVTFNYDTPPKNGEKVLLLTKGNICMVGYWSGTDKAWAELPDRDKDKERELGIHD